jgi:hypothetical protein
MNILNLIGQIFKPAMEAIDAVHTSTEEKLTKKAELLALQAAFLSKGLDYEKSMLKARAEIIITEAKSESWLTRNWRPITMLTFLILVVADQTGLLAFRLADQAWTLLQLGLGGYVMGRSAEKVGVPLLNALKKRDKT